MTLLEIMVVMGIIVAIIAIAVPRMTSVNHQMRAGVRKLATISRQIRNQARLQGAVYRLVIDLGDGTDKAKQKYWIEKATDKTVLTKDEMEVPLVPKDKKDQDDAKKNPPLFVKDNRLIKGGDAELPSPLQFENVEMKRLDGPVTRGVVAIHFFPQGFVEEAALHLKAGKNAHWTLATEPLTGRMDIIPKDITLRDLDNQ